MTGISRRRALGAGVAGMAGLAATGAGRAGAPTPPRAGRPGHVFHLAASEPNSFDGGSLRGANERNFPVLAGQQGSVYLAHLDPGGIREPHGHPTAWELNYLGVPGSALAQVPQRIEPVVITRRR